VLSDRGACEELAAAGVNDRPGVALADAGDVKNHAIEKIINEHHIQTLIAPDGDTRKEPRPARRGGLYDHVRRILTSDAGAQLYLKHQDTSRSSPVTTKDPAAGRTVRARPRPRSGIGDHDRQLASNSLCRGLDRAGVLSR
jgi:hypothetical protein